ncbi:MAG: HEAT repeat domain-containing protein [Polyangiaceae bacterium]|nr:HEAT repeat domain-containing protein [Polyangiaceae bacterium]
MQLREIEDGRRLGHALFTIYRLGKDGGEAAPAVAGLLEHPDVEVRNHAAWVIGGMGPSARIALPGLRRLLEDPNEDVRTNAEMSIRCIENPDPPRPSGAPRWLEYWRGWLSAEP